MTGSLIAPIAIIGAGIAWKVVKTPLFAVITFMLGSVLVSLRPKGDTTGGAPDIVDLLLGICLAAIIAYWVIRIRVTEGEALSKSLGQLLILLFLLWSLLSSIVGLIYDNSSMLFGARELLNLLPLLALPLLYQRYIQPESRDEKLVFVIFVICAVVVFAGNILKIVSNVAEAIYLYEVGRGNYDISLTLLVLLIATSLLMVKFSWWKWQLVVALLLLEMVGLLITLSRNSYVTAPFAMIVVVLLGIGEERRRGVLRLLYSGLLALLAAVPIVLSVRLIRLMLLSFVERFLSSGQYHTDLSLLNRYTEWQGEWLSIQQSPILGHGFGATFRFYNLIHHVHMWQGFSHSSYLYIIFKTGFVGALLFFSAYAFFFYKGYRLSRNPNLSPFTRAIVRAAFAFLIVILSEAYLGPVFDSKPSLIWLGLVWGYLLAVDRSLERSKVVLPRATLVAV